MTSPANTSIDHPTMLGERRVSNMKPASETSDLVASNESRMTVRLVVGQGTHAGAMAEIREGFYMIGRHRECQIRPKSQSVSRRHCLIQHHPDAVRVFDLESKRGTFVNDVRLKPKTWHPLNHGDRLRCGKYWFEVAIYHRESDIDLEKLEPGSVDDPSPSDSNIGAISDDDLFEDDGFALDIDSVLEAASVDVQSVAELPAVALDDFADTDVREVALPPPSSSKESTSPTRLPKPKISKAKIRSYSSGSSWFSLDFGGTDSWKVMLAIALSLTVIGYVGWSVYSFQKGPPVKILHGID